MKVLEEFGRDEALGFLASAALALSQHIEIVDMPSYEDGIRTDVIKEARQSLGIGSDDTSQQAIDQVLDFLDSESDKLISVDEESALSRLAERGDLPSDLYEVIINKNFAEALGKYYDLEKDIITTTVRAPDSEQHFTRTNNPEEPAMVSLFIKFIRTAWPFKDFYQLVVGQRNGFVLDVNQSWRIYPAKIPNLVVDKPLSVLKTFSDYFGADVNVGGRTGRFFMHLSGEIPSQLNIDTHGKHIQCYIGRFATHDGKGVDQSSLIVSIDLRKYRALLRDMSVRRDEIVTKFIHGPQPTN